MYGEEHMEEDIGKSRRARAIRAATEETFLIIGSALESPRMQAAGFRIFGYFIVLVPGRNYAQRIWAYHRATE
jgi:hypothetical protein